MATGKEMVGGVVWATDGGEVMDDRETMRIRWCLKAIDWIDRVMPVVSFDVRIYRGGRELVNEGRRLVR